MRPFFLQQIEKLNQLERLLFALIALLVFALVLILTRGILEWVEQLRAEPVYLLLFIAIVVTLVAAMLIHRRTSSWLGWLYELVEEAPEALLISDSTGQIVYANKTVRQLTGYELDELIGKTINELLEGELPSAGETLLRTRAGTTIPVVASTSEANVSGLKMRIIAAQDIRREIELREAQQRLNRRLEAMYHVASALSEYADLETILESGLEIAMKTLNAPVGRIYLLGGGGILKLVKHKGVSDKFADEVKELRYGVGNVGTVARTLKPSLVDYFTSTSEHRSICLREGLRCSAFTALKVRDTVYGVLALSYREALKWGEEELSLLEAIGNELGVAIQRSRLFENLRVSREWYRNLFMLASDGVCVLEPDGKVVDLNEALRGAFDRVYGASIQPLGKPIYELIAPYSVYTMRQWMADLVSGIGGKACEIAIGEKGQIWYEVNGSPITDEHGNTYVLCLMRDITARVKRRTTAAILESLRQALEGIHQTGEIMVMATELLSRKLNCACALMLRSDRNGNFDKLVAAIPAESSYGQLTVHRLIISEPEVQSNLKPKLENVMDARKAKILASTEDGFEGLLQLLGMSFEGQVGKAFLLPMISPERVVGVLLLLGEELEDEQVDLYQSMASELAASLETAMLCEQLSEMNKHLEELVEERTARLRALYGVSQAAQALGDIKAVMAKAICAAYSVLPCVAAGVLINIEDSSFVLACTSHATEGDVVNELVKELVMVYERNTSMKLDVSKLQVDVTREDSRSEETEWGDIGVRAWVLHSDGSIVGAFGIAQYVHQQLCSEDSDFITSLIKHITMTLQSEISSRLRERAQLSASLEALGFGVLIVNENGEILLSNSTARELLSRLGEDEQKALAALGINEMVKAMTSEQLQTLSREVMSDDRWFEVRISQRRGETQQMGYAVSLRDITEQKLTQQELTHAQRLASIGQLASGIAHEINNPLTAIVGFAELQLERQDLPDDIRRDLMRIYNAGLRARDITHKLLSFSRGLREKVLPELVDPRIAVDQALDLVASQFGSVGIKIERDYEHELPTILVSQALLQQVVLNLILNAKDAIEISGKGSKVTVKLQRHGEDHIDLVVEDDGPGIPQNVIEKIFDPFFTTKPPGKGTGLGLSIVHRYVEEMGGKISVWSREGIGTRFIVTLPITQPEQVEEAEAEGKPQIEAEHVGGRILIVDDEPSVCAFVEGALKPSGVDVVSVTDPREVMGILEHQFFDIILLDIRMPHINGLRLYELIKERMPQQAKRVVFLTGDIMSEMALEAQSKGVPMLLKPLTAAELSSFLTKLMARFAAENRA
ncbi:MAG: PAS domain S-box protein [Armatimonadota bacterium]|nr:PAS domain S-box protein [Armatimonadota bacterium]MDW8024444.1 PAS domain S-box protein [Armatimonadota bacterium]